MLPIYRFAGAAMRTVAACSRAPLLLLPMELTAAADSAPPGAVDAARLQAADSEPQNWFTGGRDQDGTYYSPLTTHQCRQRQAARLRVELRSRQPAARPGGDADRRRRRHVHLRHLGLRLRGRCRDRPGALALRSQGRSFSARNPCCDLVNRGVAVWKGKVYVASGDGRLHALDAATGAENLGSRHHRRSHSCPIRAPARRRSPAASWSSATAARTWVTAAVRGYVSAYDLETGAFKWRFLHGTAGARTAVRESGARRGRQDLGCASRRRSINGGGTAWDGFAYDPDSEAGVLRHGATRRLTICGSSATPSSTGCTPPRSSPLHADTGRLAWYYQTTPQRSLGLRLRAKVDSRGSQRRRRRSAT